MVQLAELFGGVARVLATCRDPQTVLEHIVRLAVEHLHGCEHAGISLVQGRQILSPAATGEVPLISDRLQSELGEGPCFDAIAEHAVFQTGDLRAEARWPRFSERCHRETGVLSILGVRLFVEEETIGALNLYSTLPDAFDDTDVALASVFAAHAAVAMSAARREEQLETKARHRDVIGRAKGILMARSGVDDETAFTMLRRASQRLNVKLYDVADRLASGDASAP
jgi:GAF domain-containing protein